MARAKPWEISDELWAMIEPLLPRGERRFRYPGRKRIAITAPGSAGGAGSSKPPWSGCTGPANYESGGKPATTCTTPSSSSGTA